MCFYRLSLENGRVTWIEKNPLSGVIRPLGAFKLENEAHTEADHQAGQGTGKLSEERPEKVRHTGQSHSPKKKGEGARLGSTKGEGEKKRRKTKRA